MKNKSAILLFVGLSVSFNANAWFFFFIPGSVTSAISDAVTGSEGNNCVGQQVAVGGVVKLSNGGYAKVKSLSGTSSRCPDSNMPIRAMLEPIPVGEQFTPPVSLGNAPFVAQQISNVPVTTEARLELSDDWVPKEITEDQKKRKIVLLAGNKELKATLLLSTTQSSEIETGETVTKRLLKNQSAKLDNPVGSEITSTIIHGAKAWQYHIAGNLKESKVAITYTVTLYEGDKEFVVLNTYSATENYEKLRPDLSKIENSLTGIVNTSKLKSVNQVKPQSIINSSMEQSKAKCLDLGFKTGTESFGQCVLKISK
jgi:hypothetical protein